MPLACITGGSAGRVQERRTGATPIAADALQESDLPNRRTDARLACHPSLMQASCIKLWEYSPEPPCAS
jgi:hypothetical protein